MRALLAFSLGLGLALSPGFCPAETGPVPALKNALQPESRLLTGGQPSRAQLAEAKAAGYGTIVDLRPAGEFTDYDEAAAARQLGLRYVRIPVAGAADLIPAKAKDLDAALGQAGAKPVLVHCASGNRVGALFALRAYWVQKQSPEAALAVGKAAGLTKLEGRVRELLGLPPADQN